MNRVRTQNPFSSICPCADANRLSMRHFIACPPHACELLGACRNMVFSPFKLKPDCTFIVANHMKYDFCEMDFCEKAPLEVWSCNVMEQTKAVENSSPWTGEQPHWLTSVWGGSCIKAKLQGFMCRIIVTAVCNNMTSHTTSYTGRCLSCYINLSDGSIMWLIRATSHLNTC